MKRNYTIGSILDCPEGLDLVQFTENSRLFPSKRNTVKHLKEFYKTHSNPVLIHADFIYIISRYCMFKPEVKRALLMNLVGLLNYADTEPRVLGIVMHTDYPLRKQILKSNDKVKFVLDTYTAHIWDCNKIVDYLESDIVEKSILMFANDLANEYSGIKRIYLENTTKIGPSDQGTFQYLLNLFIKYPFLSCHFGLTYDTEHEYAATGTWLPAQYLVDISNTVDLVVHLNVVPAEVTPRSLKDVHSFNTIAECSLNSPDYYITYADTLERNNIPWVREVKEETINRELEWLKSYNPSN